MHTFAASCDGQDPASRRRARLLSIILADHISHLEQHIPPKRKNVTSRSDRSNSDIAMSRNTRSRKRRADSSKTKDHKSSSHVHHS